MICLIEITLDFDTRGIQGVVWKWLMDKILIHTHMRSMEINVTRVSMILVYGALSDKSCLNELSKWYLTQSRDSRITTRQTTVVVQLEKQHWTR